MNKSFVISNALQRNRETVLLFIFSVPFLLCRANVSDLLDVSIMDNIFVRMPCQPASHEMPVWPRRYVTCDLHLLPSLASKSSGFFFFSSFSSQRILRMTEKQHERWMSESLGVPLSLNDDKCLLSFFAKPSILSVLLVKNPPVFFFVFLVLCRQESKKLYILSVNNKGWRKTQGTKICLGRTETCISISGFHFLTV